MVSLSHGPGFLLVPLVNQLIDVALQPGCKPYTLPLNDHSSLCMSSLTRDRIVATAARLFHQRGYAATGVAAILREAEVNSGSLYHYFSGKDDLLRSVLGWYAENLYPAIMQPLEQQQPDPVKRIFLLLDWYREFLHQRQCRMGCPVGNLALEISDSHPHLRAEIHRNFEIWAELLTGWLESAPEQFPPATDFSALARFILTVMEGGIMQARAAGNIAPFDESVHELRRYFDNLIGIQHWQIQQAVTVNQD